MLELKLILSSFKAKNLKLKYDMKVLVYLSIGVCRSA